MMKNNTITHITFSLIIITSFVLAACQRQESNNTSAQMPKAIAVTPTEASVSAVDNPAIKILLDRIVRSDIPSMTWDQVKPLFPSDCVANNDDRSISCPNIPGLISISYGGGPDGILDIVFMGGTASYKTLKTIVSNKFGKGEEDGAIADNNAAIGIIWWEINPHNKTYSANLGKLKGHDEVTLQIAAEQGP
jgi:hypothetical protein